MTNVALPSNWIQRSGSIWGRHVDNKLFARIRERKDAEALTIYVLLLDECGRQKTNAPDLDLQKMMQATGFSRRTVQRCRSLLLDLGLAREKKPRRGGRYIGCYLELVHVHNWFEDGIIHVGESEIDPRLFQLVRTIKDGYALGLYALLVDISIMQDTGFELRADRDWLLDESDYSKQTLQKAKKALLKLGLVVESGAKHRLSLIAKS